MSANNGPKNWIHLKGAHHVRLVDADARIDFATNRDLRLSL